MTDAYREYDTGYQIGERHGRSLGKDAMLRELRDWLRDPNRKPAHLAFTAGPERELADEIEGAMRREGR